MSFKQNIISLKLETNTKNALVNFHFRNNTKAACHLSELVLSEDDTFTCRWVDMWSIYSFNDVLSIDIHNTNKMVDERKYDPASLNDRLNTFYLRHQIVRFNGQTGYLET